MSYGNEERGNGGDETRTLSQCKVICTITRLFCYQLRYSTDIDIMALRLFGPPPRHTTYVCIWEIGVGAVNGSITPQEVQSISLALSSFRLNFTDELNVPAEELITPVDPDGNGSSNERMLRLTTRCSDIFTGQSRFSRSDFGN
jgi:hypothetical protein